RPGGGFGGQQGPQNIGAWLHIAENNSITVYTGKVEIGQNIRTSLTQVVAEELHTPVERIKLIMADTQLTPYDMGTFGSGSTPRVAPQLRRVAAATRKHLLDMTAEQEKLNRNSVIIQDGKIVEPNSKKSFDFGHITRGKKLAKAIGQDVATVPAKEWKIEGK